MPTQLLLADGQTMVRQSLKTSLEQQGFRVIAEASDGLEAVRLAGKQRPDAAILGLGMSGLNGVEAGREIRRASKDVKTILLTARADTAESHRTHIMSKLNIHATALLVRYAIRRGMVQA